MSIDWENAASRSAAELQLAGRLLDGLQDLVPGLMAGTVSNAEFLQNLQQVDLASQSVKCVSTYLSALARQQSFDEVDLRPADIAARLLGA